MKKLKNKITELRQLEELLPRQSYSWFGGKMEPINLVIIGNRRFVYRHFKKHGWFPADKLGAYTLLKALTAGILNLSYHEGPIAGGYVKGQHFMMGWQKPTKSDTFQRRHHLRLWRTPYKYFGKRVWAGTVSYDRSAGLSDQLIPVHHIAPTLSWEENFLASSLGVKRLRYLKLSSPKTDKLFTGDRYNYDGRALVLDLSGRV